MGTIMVMGIMVIDIINALPPSPEMPTKPVIGFATFDVIHADSVMPEFIILFLPMITILHKHYKLLKNRRNWECVPVLLSRRRKMKKTDEAR